MTIQIHSITLNLPRITTTPPEKLSHVNVSLETSKGTTIFSVPLTAEMLAKPLQIENVAGELLFDIITQINDHIASVEE